MRLGIRLAILCLLLAAACLGAPRRGFGGRGFGGHGFHSGIGRGFHGGFFGAGVNFRFGLRTGFSGFGVHIVTGAPVRRYPRRYYPLVVPPPVFVTQPPVVIFVNPR
jgi:hypothetical protein